ncbi:hypothetical protein CROQUDRAFT_655271 [Cronartium quercuum f. sp. fusiforme G11]|uniref:Syntaxin 6/10/61 N-terminal domain-containing protein n=1 Tax=Cronartium quercuum f. sp. fusiforme G11 TaxID=708437 RepID=A0A9P6NJF5_9BASI|nr:hypothetical protein CROQUDRAFT_655271 [Cronartium quercuum f. sp. fusiforme G11]
MSKDPYFEVKAEVESSLVSATALHSSYHRILLTLPPEAHATSDELAWARSELRATLSALMADISELDDAVNVLEKDIQASRKSKFGVSEEEVRRRRGWVKNVQAELNKMRVSSSSPLSPSSTSPLPNKSPAQATRNQGPSTYHPLAQSHSPSSQSGRLDDELEQFDQEQQHMIIDQQDRTLGTISGVVEVLREQASLMGREISEHNMSSSLFVYDLLSFP